jgi:N-acetylglucosamine kinase-like BadF-type ATPase
MYFAGIDGGQSSTTGVIGDSRGRVIGRGVSGPADEVGEGADSTRMHDALRGALEAARRDAGLRDQTRFAAIVAGVSGYDGRSRGEQPILPTSQFVLMHDARIAHAGALAGGAGIVVIAGTGSVVYASEGTRARIAGGWGFLFGDEGSAFWIVRETLARLMNSEDLQNGPDCSAQAREVCEYFGFASLRDVAHAFYDGTISRERLASFAPRAGRLPIAADLAQRGASRLALLVHDAIAAGAPARVACVGGMLTDRDYYERLRSLICGQGFRVEVIEPAYEPAVGALLLAYEIAGLDGVAIVQ